MTFTFTVDPVTLNDELETATVPETGCVAGQNVPDTGTVPMTFTPTVDPLTLKEEFVIAQFPDWTALTVLEDPLMLADAWRFAGVVWTTVSVHDPLCCAATVFEDPLMDTDALRAEATDCVATTAGVLTTLTPGVLVTANPVLDIVTVDPLTFPMLFVPAGRDPVTVTDGVLVTLTFGVPVIATLVPGARLTVDPVTLKDEFVTVTLAIV